MFKFLNLFSVFLAISSQMLFLGEHNVIYANLLSIPVIIAFIVSSYDHKIQLNIHSKLLITSIIIFIISFLWSNSQSELILRDFKPIIFNTIFIICIYNIMVIHKNFLCVFIAFWVIISINFLIFVDVIPQSLFYKLGVWEYRFLGTFSNANEGAIAFIISIIFADYALKIYKNKISLFLKYLLFSIIFLSIILLVATASKKGALVLTIYLLSKIKSLRLKNSAILGVFLIIGFKFIDTELLFQMLEKPIGRISRFFVQINSSTPDTSTTERMYFIQEGIKGFIQSPFLGNGFQSFEHKFGRYSHNNFIELLYSGGLLSLTIYYSIYYYLYNRLSATRGSIRVLGMLSLFCMLVLDFAAVTYLLKNIQYLICTLFVILKLDTTGPKLPSSTLKRPLNSNLGYNNVTAL